MDTKTALNIAIHHGSLPEVENILRERPDLLDVPLHSGSFTPLLEAISSKQHEVALWLLDKGVSPSKGTLIASLPPRFWTPLTAACTYGDLWMIETLRKRGADLFAVDAEGKTLLHHTKDISGSITRYLLDQGLSREAEDHQGKTPLIYASVNEELKMIRVLLRAGTEVNSRQGAALHASVINGGGTLTDGLNSTALLLALGADPNIRDIEGWTPLHRAAQYYNTSAILFLLGFNADLDAQTPDGRTAMEVVRTEPVPLDEPDLKVENFISLLRVGRTNRHLQRYDDNETALILAARFGVAEAILPLVSRGADLFVSYEFGTAMESAWRFDHWETAVALCKACVLQAQRSGEAGSKARAWLELVTDEANIDTPDANGFTPLMWASEQDDLKRVQALLRQGADVNAEVGYGCTALTLTHSPDIARLLLDHGARLSDLDRSLKPGSMPPVGWPQIPLYHAICRGEAGMVELLLERGAIPVWPSEGFHQQPGVIAYARGHHQVVQLLQEAGAPFWPTGDIGLA